MNYTLIVIFIRQDRTQGVESYKLKGMRTAINWFNEVRQANNIVSAILMQDNKVLRAI